MKTKTLNTAKYKLDLHKKMGAKSNLTVMEVANLMDIIHFNQTGTVPKEKSIFFSLN